VFKPASPTPLLAMRLVEIFEEAGLPGGVLNFVVGSGADVGDEFVNNRDIRAVSFTGSNEVGTRLYEEAARHLARVTCEMGGKNPVLVLDDADPTQAVEGIVQGAFGSTGQRCTATSRVIATPRIHDRLVAELEKRARAIRVGDGMDPAVQMGPAVDAGQFKTDLDYIEIARGEGAELVCGGSALTEGALAKGYFVAPTIFAGVTRRMRIFQEEVFGPVLAITKVKDFDEGIEACNDVLYGLTASIYTQDANTIMRFTDGIEAGMVHINNPTIGGEAQLPFGGTKATGVGPREMSQEGIHFFTELKTVFYDYTGKRRDTNIY
jgi:aldehyde dehydrogenase (NAD+)